MMKNERPLVYGPVPSRRLGRSLGIDLVPYKVCSYDCIYCQLGRTTHRTLERREWVPLDAVRQQIEERLATGVTFDAVTLSGCGEPTLHSGLGKLLRWLKKRVTVPVVVLTNGSLLDQAEVRTELQAADVVIPSLDAAEAPSFHYVNRPHPRVDFDAIVDGLVDFTRSFAGRVWLEVLLIDGITGIAEEAAGIARLAERIRPERVHLGTVTRPPAEPSAIPVAADRLKELAALFHPLAEVIPSRGPSRSPVPDSVSSDEVLALLRRRPCTLHDLACGIGASEPCLVKLLDDLIAGGMVATQRAHGVPYFRAVQRARAWSEA